MDIFINHLRSELEKRKQKNSRYSLRSFARLLNEEPSFLSKILNGKRQLSVQKVWQYGEKLAIPTQELEKIVSRMAARKKQRRQRVKSPNYIDARKIGVPVLPTRLHFLIPEVLKLKDCKKNLQWLSKKLNSDEVHVKKVVSELIDLKVLDENLSVIGPFSFIVDKTNSKSAKQLMTEIFIQALDDAKVSIGDQDNWQNMAHGVNFVAIHQENIEEARKRIGDFRRELSRFLESSLDPNKKPDKLICLSTIFFPLLD